MGFTWEVPVHFFVRRAWVLATEFGTADEHAEQVAELPGLGSRDKSRRAVGARSPTTSRSTTGPAA